MLEEGPMKREMLKNNLQKGLQFLMCEANDPPQTKTLRLPCWFCHWLTAETWAIQRTSPTPCFHF